MSITAGSRLGPYEVIAPLGAGGMGAVFHARDTRLGRSVAIKVILETFAADSDRIARFEREARMLAALNHPRIAALFGIEQADGRHFLVMELIDGETIADRLRRGPMPVEEALAIGLQIAEALEAAHEKGVVHRDLKPANVKITTDQQVKVLDFGLAKAMENEPHASEIANSPTLSMMATQAGVILGTAAYMSPEQAKGFPADHRSDVFSFGTVLFEMLTGRQPFQGETAPEVLASVLVREPELASLPLDLNPRVADLIKRCLEKSPKKRWQHIGDVRAELESLVAAPRSVVLAAMHAPPQPLWKRVLVPAAVAIVAAAMTGVTAWNLRPAEPLRGVVRVQELLPAGQNWAYTGRIVLDISRDGSRLAYIANNKLYVRELAEFEGSLVPGTASQEVVTGPAFSPDGRFVAVYSTTEQSLKKVPIGGGAAVNLCATGNPMGVYWSSDGWVYLSSVAEGIRRVRETGGTPEQLVPASTEERYQSARPLPDGEHLIFAVSRGSASDRWDTGQIVAHNIKTGSRKTLIEGGGDPRLLPGGVLAYAHRGIVYGAPFDAARLELTGPAVPILEGVRRAPGNAGGNANFAFSDAGTLVYLDGPITTEADNDVLMISTPEGAREQVKLPGAAYRMPRVSRDGKKIAYELLEQNRETIYVADLDGSAAPRKLTFEGRAVAPLFSHDGRRVIFGRDSDVQSERGVYWTRTDGTGGVERLTVPATGRHVPDSISSDGRFLLFSSGSAGSWSLHVLSMTDRKVTQVLPAIATAPVGAQFSTDGKWIAYAVPSGGRYNVFVEPFPATGAKFEVPRRTGDDPHHPVWSRDGRTLYYTARPGGIDKVAVTINGGSVEFGNPVAVGNAYRTQAPLLPRTHDLLPDGRFIGLGSANLTVGPATSAAEIRFIFNWFESLRDKLQPR